LEADAQRIKAAKRCRSTKKVRRALKSDRKETEESCINAEGQLYGQALPIKEINLFLYTKNRKTLNAFFSKSHFSNLRTS